MKYDLSILIPARNEIFLKKTVENLLENIEGNTEILVGLDGQWADPGLVMHPRVTILYYPVSIGQRAMTNRLCDLSSAKYVMKVDAHCAFDKGFDVKLMADMQDNWTMVPRMYNLHAFNWVCKKCGNKWYQGPTPVNCCSDPDGRVKNETCDSAEFEKEIIWQPRWSRKSDFYRFDKTLHFQYWGSLEKRPESQTDIAETMSIQGSCFILTREKYKELNICDEAHGSWGQQGVEVSCKTWLSGGRVVVNKKTWYAHMFRTQGGDFGFPYPNPGSEQEKARKFSRELWLNNKWPLAIHPFDWIIKKFNPPDWDVSKGVVYYTDNEIAPKIADMCKEQLRYAFAGRKIVSVGLQETNFGDVSVVCPWKRGYLTMFKQILDGLKRLDTDVVFLCEHDVLYHESHFDFTPPKKDVYYYNMNSWIVRTSDGLSVYYDHKSLSGLCADRQFLITHFKERIRRVEAEGFSRKMGFEPGTHNRPERVDDFKAEGYRSEQPNADLKHGKNLTEARWRPEDFRSQRNCRNWQEKSETPHWGKIVL